MILPNSIIRHRQNDRLQQKKVSWDFFGLHHFELLLHLCQQKLQVMFVALSEGILLSKSV